MSKIAHQVCDDGVLIVLRHAIGAPSSMRVGQEEAICFARALLDDLDPAGEVAAAEKIVIGRLSLVPADGAAFVDDNHVRLTGREFDFLHRLARSPGHQVTKQQLMDALYGGRDEPETKIIDVFACKTRNKLSAFGADQMIETVWGRGYRLVPEPTPGAFEPPLIRGRPSHIQQAIVARLGAGPAKFPDLWGMLPDHPATSIRNAILTLRQRGVIESSGEPRAALYSLKIGAAA